ncbi:Guanylate kinase [bioreactor metagenome]|uniref:Guanylate kinase n=1 Tax=bioreactor metagenome TaxID=1076179 RepID=A0A645CBP6_9ZZZZ
MKSNISKKDIESGKNIIELLQQKNPKLLPHQLQDIISEYKKFSVSLEKFGIWTSPKSRSKKFKQKYSKVILLFSGVTAGGKDAIREEIEILAPNLFKKTVTGTSRPPREGEIEGKDYFFFESSKSFRTSIKNQEFLEYIKRGEHFYGLPKKSLNEALTSKSPVVYSQIEMSGWSKTEKYLNTISQSQTLILKVFVLPDMNFNDYQKWLIEKRTNEDIDIRLAKTGWEIKKAPKKADFIVTNRIREDKKFLSLTAKAIINQISEILDFPTFPNFPNEFTIDPQLKKSKNIEAILSFHDSI